MNPPAENVIKPVGQPNSILHLDSPTLRRRRCVVSMSECPEHQLDAANVDAVRKQAARAFVAQVMPVQIAARSYARATGRTGGRHPGSMALASSGQARVHLGVDYQVRVPAVPEFHSFFSVVVVVNNPREPWRVDHALKAKALRPVRITVDVEINSRCLMPLDANNTNRLEPGAVPAPSISIEARERRTAVFTTTLVRTSCPDFTELVPPHVFLEQLPELVELRAVILKSRPQLFFGRLTPLRTAHAARSDGEQPDQRQNLHLSLHKQCNRM